MKKSKQIIAYITHVICPLILFSIIIGTLVGVTVTLYNFAAGWLVTQSRAIYAFSRTHYWAIPLLFGGLIGISLLISALLKITPECKGSGVPRTEGVLRGILTFRWLRVFLTTILSSALTYISGMSLGSEGPSVQLGATIANGVNATLNKRNVWSRQLMTGGASAGLAVAFNAPLTAIVFSMEEVHKRVSPFIIFATASCVLISTAVSRALASLWGGGGILFDMGSFSEIPLKDCWMLILLGIVIGLCASLFVTLITKSNGFISKIKHLPQTAKIIIGMLITGIIGLACLDTVGSGHGLIMDIGADKFSIGILALLFFLKLFLVTANFNSGVTGGLFIPMLCIGALLGGFFGELFVLIGLDPIFYKTIVVIAMTAFFGACVRAPITAIVLIVEITGHLNGFLMTGFTIFTAFFIPQIFRIAPLYDSLLDRIVDKEVAKEPPLYQATKQD